MTSATSSEPRACVDCKHCETVETHYWGPYYICGRPLPDVFGNVTGWVRSRVNLHCNICRNGTDDEDGHIREDFVCGEQAIHFQPKPVLPPEVVTKGIKAIPVNTGITFSVSGPEIEKTQDNRVFWCAIIAALAFGAWCLLK